MKCNRKFWGWLILCSLLFASGTLGQTFRGGVAGTVADKS